MSKKRKFAKTHAEVVRTVVQAIQASFTIGTFLVVTGWWHP